MLATVGALAPLIEAGLTVEDPAIAPVVTAAFTEVQTDLGTFESIVKQAGTTPTALSVLNSVNANLAAVLTDAQVKNSAKIADITATVNAVTSEIDAITAYFPAQTRSLRPAGTKTSRARARRNRHIRAESLGSFLRPPTGPQLVTTPPVETGNSAA